MEKLTTLDEFATKLAPNIARMEAREIGRVVVEHLITADDSSEVDLGRTTRQEEWGS